jgi:putative FmdB family regulatory protein
MARFDFACSQCGLEFEISRQPDDTTPVTCPLDASPCTRVFRAPKLRNRAAGGAGGWLPRGHVHGPGGHTHGPGEPADPE